MPKFVIDIFSPSGPWTTKEIKRMIDFWFKEQAKKGIAYKVIYSVKKEIETIKLGDKVKDSASGLEGIAITRHTYLNGCDRITIQPKVTDPSMYINSQTFDESQLIILNKRVVKMGF